MAEARGQPLRALRVAVAVAVCTAIVGIAALATQVPPPASRVAVWVRRRWAFLGWSAAARWGERREKEGRCCLGWGVSQSAAAISFCVLWQGGGEGEVSLLGLASAPADSSSFPSWASGGALKYYDRFPTHPFGTAVQAAAMQPCQRVMRLFDNAAKRTPSPHPVSHQLKPNHHPSSEAHGQWSPEAGPPYVKHITMWSDPRCVDHAGPANNVRRILGLKTSWHDHKVVHPPPLPPTPARLPV